MLSLAEAICIIAAFFLCPYNLSATKTECYYTLCGQLVIFFLLQQLFYTVDHIDIFSPLLLYTVIHLLLFEITPLICLWTGDFEWFEMDLWGGGVKGTWFSTIGYVAAFIAYYLEKGKFVIHTDNSPIEEKVTLNEKKALIMNIVIWSIAFLCNIVLIVSSGKNLAYIFSLGLSEDAASTTGSGSFEFLGIIAYAMLPSYLYIFWLSKSRVLKAILFYLMAMTFLYRGFRFILVAIIVSPLIVIFLRRDKRPKLIVVAVLLILLLILSSFVGAVRKDVRGGSGVTDEAVDAVDTEYIVDVFTGNFSIFKTYYGIVEHVPSDIGYTNGSQIFLYTAEMFIPRAIWQSKPQPILRKIIAVSVNDYSVVAGTAYPYIGEYYHEFGLIGIIVLCFIMGRLLRVLNYYKRRNGIHSIVLFATLYPLVLQVLIRGYTPSNFYMILFVVIPIILTSILCKGNQPDELS